MEILLFSSKISKKTIFILFFQKSLTFLLFKDTLIRNAFIAFRSGLTDLTVVFPSPEKKTSWEAAIQEAKEKLGKTLASYRYK